MSAQVIQGHCLEVMRGLSAQSVQTCVTSPPYYGLRNYNVDGQIGLEDTPEAFVSRLVEVFREVRRVLRDDGTLFLNIGDTYAGFNNGYAGDSMPSNAVGSLSRGGGQRTMSQRRTVGNGLKNKDLIGIPWMLAFALRADGWYLRQDIIWHKPNPMPEPVQDRCTKAHEYVFLLSKSPRYFYNVEAVREKATGREPGNVTHKYADEYERDQLELHRTKAGLKAITASEWRNKRSVWSISPKPFHEAHFATMPVELASMCILAGSRPGDTVLDPFMGAYTTAYAALQLGRNAVGAELNPEYMAIGERRIRPLLMQPALLGVS